MVKFNTIAGLGALVMAGALAGCQMAPSGGMPLRPAPISPGPQQPQSGVEGNWIDEAGSGISVFEAGRFETVAADSGQRLSEGNYIVSGNLVQINGTSIIRQTSVSFNCAIATQSQLNCTAASGQQFVLSRYNGPMPAPSAQPPVAGVSQPPRI